MSYVNLLQWIYMLCVLLCVTLALESLSTLSWSSALSFTGAPLCLSLRSALARTNGALPLLQALTHLNLSRLLVSLPSLRTTACRNGNAPVVLGWLIFAWLRT